MGNTEAEVKAFIAEAASAKEVPPDMPMMETSASVVEPAPQKPNRRIQPRYIAHWRAALVVEGIKHFGKTENVSLSGVAITCTGNLRQKQEVTIYLEVTVMLGKPPVVFEAVGVVMHSSLSSQGFRLGVAFRFFHGDSLDILRKALASGTYRQMLDPN